MKYCEKCGQELSDTANFCGKCGKSSGFVVEHSIKMEYLNRDHNIMQYTHRWQCDAGIVFLIFQFLIIVFATFTDLLVVRYLEDEVVLGIDIFNIFVLGDYFTSSDANVQVQNMIESFRFAGVTLISLIIMMIVSLIEIIYNLKENYKEKDSLFCGYNVVYPVSFDVIVFIVWFVTNYYIVNSFPIVQVDLSVTMIMSIILLCGQIIINIMCRIRA